MRARGYTREPTAQDGTAHEDGEGASTSVVAFPDRTGVGMLALR